MGCSITINNSSLKVTSWGLTAIPIRQPSMGLTMNWSVDTKSPTSYLSQLRAPSCSDMIFSSWPQQPFLGTSKETWHTSWIHTVPSWSNIWFSNWRWNSLLSQTRMCIPAWVLWFGTSKCIAFNAKVAVPFEENSDFSLSSHLHMGNMGTCHGLLWMWQKKQIG